MEYHREICRYLDPMEPRQIIDLGGELGLQHKKLNKMTNLPSEMVAAWLRGENSCNPTWSSLAEALKEIGQNGIAGKIEDDHINVATPSPSTDSRSAGSELN